MGEHVAARVDREVEGAGALQQLPGAVERPALDEPGGIDRAETFPRLDAGIGADPDVERPPALFGHAITQRQHCSNVRAGVGETKVAAPEAADLGVVPPRGEHVVDMPEPVEDLVDDGWLDDVAHVEADGGAPDLLDAVGASAQ